MQTLTEIRQLLSRAGLKPRRRLGQCFLIDKNLMGKVLNLADLTGCETVLEVGAGTGSLTEELLDRAARVVAVEIDRGLARILADRLGGRQGLALIGGDVLAGKHLLEPQVISALGSSAHLVANLPYKIATPLIALCLKQSWLASVAGRKGCVHFERLTFTVQREVADRLTAGPGSGAYGPISIMAGLLGRLTAGPIIPASAFWPTPKVGSRAIRIDIGFETGAQVADIEVLRAVVALAFSQRRKQIGSILKRVDTGFDRKRLADAMSSAGVDPVQRAQDISPEQFRVLANALSPG